MAATSSATFAAAIVQRGVDAGLVELRRYLLTRTTSSQTFESTLAKTIRLTHVPARAASAAVDRIVQIREALPRDEQRAKRWIYRGLRGPIDEALIDLAAQPDNVDTACELLDATWRSLERVDVNKAYRGSRPQFRLLPVQWLHELFRDVAPSAEAAIAMALASLLPSEPKLGTVAPFLLYRIGVEPARARRGYLVFPKEASPRRVWSGASLDRDLCLVLKRRLLDAAPLESPFRSRARVPIAAIAAFLSGDLDGEAIGRWLCRMCLFDWQAGVRAPAVSVSYHAPVDGLFALYGFFKPLFHAWPAHDDKERALFTKGSRASSAAAVARVATRLDAGDVEGALGEARARYRAGGRFPTQIVVPSTNVDTARLLAALLMPTSSRHLLNLAERWLGPERRKDNPE